jgi:hypothetical protein
MRNKMPSRKLQKSAVTVIIFVITVTPALADNSTLFDGHYSGEAVVFHNYNNDCRSAPPSGTVLGKTPDINIVNGQAVWTFSGPPEKFYQDTITVTYNLTITPAGSATSAGTGNGFPVFHGSVNGGIINLVGVTPAGKCGITFQWHKAS